MVIWLSDDCYIKAEDGVCFELMKRYKVQKEGKSKGQWRQKVLGYYGTLEQAARGALNKAVLGADDEVTIKELITYLERVSKQIESACETSMAASQAASISASYAPEELSQLLFFGDDND